VTTSSNVDLVRSIFAAWEGGDYSTVEWADPEIEFVFADGAQAGSWRGMAAMTEVWRDYLRVWEDYSIEAEEYRELDDERVLVLVRNAGRGKTSGLEVGQLGPKGATLCHVRDGKVTRLVSYWDRDRALADLGLVPE
jgi:ketosteroid isomerase-like protein